MQAEVGERVRLPPGRSWCLEFDEGFGYVLNESGDSDISHLEVEDLLQQHCFSPCGGHALEKRAFEVP